MLTTNKRTTTHINAVRIAVVTLALAGLVLATGCYRKTVGVSGFTSSQYTIEEPNAPEPGSPINWWWTDNDQRDSKPTMGR